jgi:hypothetical protein
MDRLITADARAVTPQQFFDAITGDSAEKRAERDRVMHEQCIRAIERGDTYGWPPAMVEECRAIMAERQVTERDLRFTMEMQRKVRAA